MGPPRRPESLDWRLVLDCNGARMVGFHAWGNIRAPAPDVARRKLCSVQLPDDLFRRFHSGLAISAAVPLLPLGRVSEAEPRRRARAVKGFAVRTEDCP